MKIIKADESCFCGEEELYRADSLFRFKETPINYRIIDAFHGSNNCMLYVQVLGQHTLISEANVSIIDFVTDVTKFKIHCVQILDDD